MCQMNVVISLAFGNVPHQLGRRPDIQVAVLSAYFSATCSRDAAAARSFSRMNLPLGDTSSALQIG